VGRKGDRSGERRFGWWPSANRRANEWQVWPGRDGCLAAKPVSPPWQAASAASWPFLSRPAEAFAMARHGHGKQTLAQKAEASTPHRLPSHTPMAMAWSLVRGVTGKSRDGRKQTATRRRRRAQNARRCLPPIYSQPVVTYTRAPAVARLHRPPDVLLALSVC
jgi:hypothetical protein